MINIRQLTHRTLAVEVAPCAKHAREIAKLLFDGKVCPRLLDEANRPMPDPETAEARYQEWVELVTSDGRCGTKKALVKKGAKHHSRLESLRSRRSEIEGKIARIEAKDKATLHKNELRLKIIIGTAIPADADQNPSKRASVVEVLNRASIRRGNKSFLEKMGWV